MLNLAMLSSTGSRRRVVSPPPVGGGGGGGTSPLAIQAAAMSPGTWAEMTTVGITGALLSALNEGGVGGNSIPYTNQMAWNPITKQIKLTCSDHGAAYMPELTYDVATNTWSSVNAGTAPSGAWPFGTHAYGHFSIRPDTGDLYSRYNGGGTAQEPVFRRLAGGSWAIFNRTGSTTYTQIGVGSAWWPGSNTGANALAGHGGVAGCYILCEIALGVLMTYDPIADAWGFILVPQTNPPTDVYHTVAAWSRPLNCMVYGGGNSSVNADTKKWLWRLDQDATTHRLTDCPIGVGIQHANLVADPVSGKFLIWGEGRNFYELDPAGTGTYTLLTGSRQPPAVGLHGVADPSQGAGGPDAMVSCPLPDHGVIAYMSASGASYTNMFLYKHA